MSNIPVDREEMPVEKRTRNGSIDLMKFVYAWFIVYYHLYFATHAHFISGRYAVEFFLLAAGAYFFRAMESSEGEPPRKYIVRRFWRFFPWAATAFVFAFVVIRVVVNRQSPASLARSFSGDIWELLLVKMNGMNQGKRLLNCPVWTVSCMLLVEIVMAGWWARDKRGFVEIVMPLSLIVGFGYWRHVESTDHAVWMGFAAFGTVRVWLVYICGYCCWRTSRYLGEMLLNRKAEAALTVVEMLCHVFAVWVMLRYSTRNFQWCVLLAFLVATVIELSGHSLWEVALRRASKLTGWLGRVSFSVYLVHWPIIKYFEAVYPDTGALYAHAGAVTGTVLCAAAGHCFLTAGLIRLWKRGMPKLKRTFYLPDRAGLGGKFRKS